MQPQHEDDIHTGMLWRAALRCALKMAPVYAFHHPEGERSLE